jgi:hypothetical protein
MRFACWITKATDTHSEYVTLIAFPRQNGYAKRASMFVHTYIAYLVSPSSVVALKEKARRSHTAFCSKTKVIASQAVEYSAFAPQLTNCYHTFTAQL